LPRALLDNTANHSRDEANGAQKPRWKNLDIAKSDCTAAVFAIHAFDDWAAPMSSRVVEATRMRVARTLSRDFWQ
jgi:hypothetical protein